MPEKNRSAGITVIAILALIGSALLLAFAAFMAFAMIVATPPANDPRLPPGFFTVMRVVLPLFYALPAVWGIVTAIGLLQAQKLGAYFHHRVFRSPDGVWCVRNAHGHGFLSQTASGQWRGPQNVSHHWSSHGCVRSGSNRHRHLVDGLLQSRPRKSAVPASAVSVPRTRSGSLQHQHASLRNAASAGSGYSGTAPAEFLLPLRRLRSHSAQRVLSASPSSPGFSWPFASLSPSTFSCILPSPCFSLP